MPYIDQKRRPKLEGLAKQAAYEAKTEGELNYFIFTLLIHYLRDAGKNYAVLNGLIGVLTCCRDEFYRRVVAPYEDQKCSENGDVL